MYRPAGLIVVVAAGLALTACGGATGSAATAPAASSTSAAVAATPVKLVIMHVTAGCHDWALNGGAAKAAQTVSLTAGQQLTVVNDDVMPHVLKQLSGPAAAISGAAMGKPAATAAVTFTKPGTYTFKTVAGEDYPSAAGIQTTGEDHVLKLTVNVA